MLKRFTRGRIVEHTLEGIVHALRLPNLLDRAAIVPGIRHRGLLGAQDECVQRRQIREALVALSVPERRVEERQGCPVLKKSSI